METAPIPLFQPNPENGGQSFIPSVGHKENNHPVVDQAQHEVSESEKKLHVPSGPFVRFFKKDVL